MAYEASEIMTAAALQYSSADLQKIKTAGDLQRIIADGKKNIDSNTEFGDGSIRQGFISRMNPSDKKSVKDMAVGVSAALAVRKYMKKSSGKITVYMTGNKWPKDVEKFKVSAFGFQDYNSADILTSSDKKTFYGFSLKKKNKVKAQDPTLINKAFDSVFEGSKFKPLKEELNKTRISYFAGLVKEAVKQQIILEKDISGFKTLSDKELFEAKKRDKKQFDRPYIDIKGYATSPKGYFDDNTRDSKSMRFFVNDKLSDKKNKLFLEFQKLMTKDAKTLAENLINIILKIYLFDKIEEKDLKNFHFDFALLTGVGDVVGDKADIGPARLTTLKTTLCGLDRIREKYKGEYSITPDVEEYAKSKAAKLFFKLTRGGFKLMDLQVRYKGKFTPQAQFQGNISKEFKSILDQETCG
jgi:hypothetical protein